jgi:hypothetical protein
MPSRTPATRPGVTDCVGIPRGIRFPVDLERRGGYEKLNGPQAYHTRIRWYRKRSERLYLGLMPHETFCDDEHSRPSVRSLKTISNKLTCKLFDAPTVLPALYAFELLGRKGPRLSRGDPARPAQFAEAPNMQVSCVPRCLQF